MKAPRDPSVPARNVFDTPCGERRKKRLIGSTLPGAVSENRLFEISVWAVRALDVSTRGFQLRTYPKCHASFVKHLNSDAYADGFPRIAPITASLLVRVGNRSASGRSSRASAQVGPSGKPIILCFADGLFEISDGYSGKGTFFFAPSKISRSLL